MIPFLDCCIHALPDGTYQLHHCSGATWKPTDLQTCQQLAAKAWVLHCDRPAAAIQPRGWCVMNLPALKANWLYCLFALPPSQIYQRILKLPETQGIWRGASYQKILVGDREVVLLKQFQPFQGRSETGA